jgi:hypothetical protein
MSRIQLFHLILILFYQQGNQDSEQLDLPKVDEQSQNKN